MHHLLPQCTVLENVLIPTLADSKGEDKEKLVARAKALLQKVHLENHADHRPAQLSGGEQQRVAVVRAMIYQPPILLADEPTGSLDQKSAENLAQILLQLNKEEEVALIVVTHSEKLAANMQRVYDLNNGKLEVRNK